MGEINFAKVSHFGKVKEMLGIRYQVSGVRHQVIGFRCKLKKGLLEKSGSPHCVTTQFWIKNKAMDKKIVYM